MRPPLAIAACAAALAAACTCPTPAARFAGDFDYCEDATCGWTIASDGEGSGSAAIVATVHPGEHGLLLEGNVTATKAAAVSTGTYYDDGLWVELTTTCEGPIALQLTPLAAGLYRLDIQLPPGPEATDPARAAYHRAILSLPPEPDNPFDEECDPALDPYCYPDDGYGYDETPYTIDSVRIVGKGGACVVDQLRLMMPTECYW